MTQPLVLASDQSIVSFAAQLLVLLASYLIDGFTQMLRHMKLVADDLAIRVRQMLFRRSDIGIPYPLAFDVSWFSGKWNAARFS